MKTYKKDFDKWNEQKKITHNNENKKTFHEQEIWFAKIGENVGFEQDGRGDEFLSFTEKKAMQFCRK